MNRVELASVVVHMVWMNAFKFLLVGVMLVTILSCAQTEYVDVESSGIKHSDPDVISLYEGEALPSHKKSGGFLDRFLDGMLGSSPDDDRYDDSRERGRFRKKQEFISENGDSLRSDLESKKR